MKQAVSFTDIAEAICRGVLGKYADPQGFNHPDRRPKDGLKPNRQGVIVQFSRSTRQIQFRFFLRDFPGALVNVTYKADDFAADPAGFILATHQEMKSRIAQYARDKNQSIILLTPGNERNEMAAAINEALN